MHYRDLQKRLWTQIEEYTPIYGDRVSPSESIKRAFFDNPRHVFLDRFRSIHQMMTGPTRSLDSNQDLEAAYQDQPLMYVDNHDRVLAASSSEPSFIFHLLGLLDLKPGHSVLEVGCGTGWLLSVMSDVVGDGGRCKGIEIIGYLGKFAKSELRDRSNVEVYVGDGITDIDSSEKYDRVIFTASSYYFPRFLFDVVAENGVVIIPLRSKGASEEVQVLRKLGDTFVAETCRYAKFVPIISRSAGTAMPFNPIESIPIYSELINLGISKDKFRIGNTPDPDGLTLMREMVSFTAFLSRYEPSFEAVCWHNDAGYGTNFETAIYGDPGSTAFGIFLPEEKSMALWHKGEVTYYSNTHAGEKFEGRFQEWKSMNSPRSVDFGLIVHREEPAIDIGAIEKRGRFFFQWTYKS